MSKKVTLREVTADNWEEVAELEVHEHQENFVQDNTWSLAESKFDPHMVPRAIYAGKKVVGFVMWETHAEYGTRHDYSIDRLMIDKDHQSKGYGRRALSLALAEIRKDRHWRRIIVYYVPENVVAREFYAGFGFRELGVDEDGEMVAEILPEKD